MNFTCRKELARCGGGWAESFHTIIFGVSLRLEIREKYVHDRRSDSFLLSLDSREG